MNIDLSKNPNSSISIRLEIVTREQEERGELLVYIDSRIEEEARAALGWVSA